MSESSDSEASPVLESEGKKKKAKKRPSDFEIVRTILQRTHERKLPYLLKDMGEDPDILVFCSKDEKEFTYGSPDISIALFEFTDPELSDIVTTHLNKLYGLQPEDSNQRIINVRDQISELSKTKGESFGVDVHKNVYGSVWTVRKDVRGQERYVHFNIAVDCLFRMKAVQEWCQKYRRLLTSDNQRYLYYPYRHPDSNTGSIVTLPPSGGDNHPIGRYYPHGFRFMATRGLDIILDKFLEDFPYPVIQEELIVFQDESITCQIAHRIIAQGWKMVLIRPNAVYFPTLRTSIPTVGYHTL